MRRGKCVGGYPDTFGERLRRGRCAPGELGQFVESAHPLTYCEPLLAVLDDLNLLDGTCKFAWQDGDGNTPTIGPALTTVGAPVPGQPTGLVDVNGLPITQDVYDGVSYRGSAVFPALGGAEDAILITFSRDGLYTCGTWDVNDGILAYFTGSNYIFYIRENGGAPITTGNVLCRPIALNLCVGRLARGGTSYGFANGARSAGAATPGGAIVGTGVGLNTGGVPHGGVNPSYIAAAAIFYGLGIATAWPDSLIVEITHRVFGIGPIATFTRATFASWRGDGARHIIASSGMPRAGDGTGLTVEAQRTNHVYRTIGVPAGALAEWIGDDASTATGVADVAALTAANAEVWGERVSSYANATGAARYLRCGAATGAVTRFALSLYARILAGAGAEIGWWDTAGPGWSAVGAITDDYDVRTVYENLVPPAVTCHLCIHIPDGCTLRWFAAQCEGSGSLNECIATTPILNAAVAATAQRNWDDLVIGHDPADGGGSLEFTITPRRFSGAESGGVSVVFLTGGGFASFAVNGGTWRAELLDGATSIDSGVAPVVDVAHTIRLRWVTGSGMSLEVRDEAGAVLGRTDVAYDGSLRFAGSWEWIAGAAGYTISNIRCYKNGAG